MEELKMTENEVANKVLGMRLEIGEWKIQTDEKTKLPKIAGRYEIKSGEKTIAKQNFNDGYGTMDLAFSLETIQKAKELTDLVLNDVQRLVR
jgi:hypothetical protein